MWWLSLLAHADTCETYGNEQVFSVTDAPVGESSGLAASRARPGVMFTHGDKGGGALLYAFDLDGSYLGSHVVDGAAVVDWEDLAPGPCPNDGGPCLYVGDIGDNDAVRPTITVYVAREPEAEGDGAKRLETWEAVYPDGPQDAETLLVHPCTGDLYVVTKGANATGTVYRFPRDRSQTSTLEAVAELALDDNEPITGGQWDLHGDRLVIRTRDRIFEWVTDPLDPDAHWETAPKEIGRVDEAQGEGVAYTLDGAIATTSEGLPLEVHLLPCLAEGAATGECTFVPEEGGCGCASSPSPVGAGWVLTFVVLLARRRTLLEVSS